MESIQRPAVGSRLVDFFRNRPVAPLGCSLHSVPNVLCFKTRKEISKGHLLHVIVFIILLFTLNSPGWAQTNQKKSLPLDRRVAELEAELTRLKKETDVYTIVGLPENFILCDRKISIFKDEIRERFEREFFQILEDKGLLTIIVKRYFKYLKMINEETKRLSLPSDLIFLAITESYLNPRALSSASAAGLWQFVKETGKKEGLYINDNIDERYNIKKATRLALNHLKKLHDEFGDWLIAVAAYNAGVGRLREAIENQGTSDFFELYLPEETERYIFRIMAFKEIILNRERYGLNINEKELYKLPLIKDISIETKTELHTSVLAKCMDMPYKAFRDCNLHIRKYRLPRGTYQINVPLEKYETFLKRLKLYPYLEVVKEN